MAREEWITLLCRHFDSWGLSDRLVARAAAERVMQRVDAYAEGSVHVEPVEVATAWIRAMADEGGESPDWFFRAPALLARFPAAFLETDLPDLARVCSVELLPEPAPRAMPEQEVIGPITHAVRVATEAMEGVTGPLNRAAESRGFSVREMR